MMCEIGQIMISLKILTLMWIAEIILSVIAQVDKDVYVYDVFCTLVVTVMKHGSDGLHFQNKLNSSSKVFVTIYNQSLPINRTIMSLKLFDTVNV